MKGQAHKVAILEILSKDQQGNNNMTLAVDIGASGSLCIQPKEMCPSEFSIEWQHKQHTLSLKWDMGQIKELAIATSRTEVNIHFYGGLSKSRESASHFPLLDPSKICTLLVVCNQALPLEIVRCVEKEFEGKKSRPRGKRVRECCDACDCCTNLQEELGKRQKELDTVQRRKDEVDAELKHVALTGMRPDFERDFYTPVVYNSQLLSYEITQLKKTINREPGLLPSRTMGMFDERVLLRANLDEIQANMLLRETLNDPLFSRKCPATISHIRKKYGEEILKDALRCLDEIDTYNASAGHPVMLAWDWQKDREMTASEMVDGVVHKYREATDKIEHLEHTVQDLEHKVQQLEDERDKLCVENERLRDQMSSLGISEQRNNNNRMCIIM